MSIELTDREHQIIQQLKGPLLCSDTPQERPDKLSFSVVSYSRLPGSYRRSG